MMRSTSLLTLVLALFPIAVQASPDAGKQEVCPQVRIEVEQLPDLNIPRAGHEVFCVNGELTVAGGHTDGFVPTPTAEYLKDGEWHTILMTYPHDNGFSVVLSSGKVMLGGGSEEPIGIGQTFVTEFYDPQTHSFSGYCSLQRKRTNASALELDSGRVVVAGNWYFNDGIEVFSDPKGTRADYNGYRLFNYIKDVSVQRAYPLIYRTAKDDVLIFGGNDVKGDSLWTSTAYNLKGDSVRIPLLEDWCPLSTDMARSSESFIGDTDKGIYAYLMAVKNRDGQAAIAKVVNGEFSLLPTDCPVPIQSHGERIYYSSTILVDQKAGRGYLIGISNNYHSTPEKPWRWYVLAIDYTKQPATLTLCYTDPLPEINTYSPILTPEGNLLIAGGLYHASNFTPSKRVILLRVGREPATAKTGVGAWLMGVLAALLLLALLAYLFLYKRNHGNKSHDSLGTPSDQGAVPIIPSLISDDEALIQRIRELMQIHRPFLDSNLKVSDVAALLGTNGRYISRCINACEGRSFSDFVNDYRIEYAKQLMRDDPDIKIGTAGTAAGFSSEQSFFRTFKSVTGMTPREWKAQID